MTDNVTFIPSVLKSGVIGGYVTSTDQILDEGSGKTQKQINAGIEEASGRLDERIDNVIDGMQARIDTVVETASTNLAGVIDSARSEFNSAVESANSTIDGIISTASSTIDGIVESANSRVNEGIGRIDAGLAQIDTHLENAQEAISAVEDLQADVVRIVNNELYGGDEKPAGVTTVTTDNATEILADTVSSLVETSIENTDFQGMIDTALSESLPAVEDNATAGNNWENFNLR